MIEIVPDDIAPSPDAFTRMGQPIWFWNPERTVVDHEEVLTVLAEQYRYSGHFPVSILMHSWIVAEIAALLGGDAKTVGCAGVHDCHEVYSQDLPRGLKVLLRDYARIEAGREAHVRAAFGYPSMSEAIAFAVKVADRLAVPVELRLVGIAEDHPLYLAALLDVGDDRLVSWLYDRVEELAASMPHIGALPDPRAVGARWQALTCPHLPALVMLGDDGRDLPSTLASRVIARQRLELDLLHPSAPTPPGVPFATR